MIPTIVPLPQGLPLTPNGKLDHQALPTPQPTTTPTTPRTPTETLICQLFAETLNLPHIGIHDNFFELGGDSIVAIRLVARARSRGVRISARDVFRHQTVAALAEHAQVSGQQASAGTPGEASGPTGRAEPRTELPPADAPSGPVVLTPILRWRHDSGGPVDGFHQSVLVRTPAGLGLPRLHRMLQALLDRHDALRTRWETTADWRLEVLPRGAVPASACLTRVDATGAGDEALRNMVAAHADEARRQLAPGRGRMLQGVWFDAGPDRPGRLLLLINHLVVDGVSWRILLQDLRTAWDLFKEHVPGAEPGPAVPTDTWVTERMANPPVSFEEWGRLLAANARERTGELSFWTGLFEGVGDVVDGADLVAGRDVLRTQATVSRVLPADLTEDLLNRAPTATGTGINAVLLTALGEAVHRWRSAKVPGNTKPFLVDIEGHGREEIAEDLDLSSTVGWFTSMFPVRLECHPGAPERTMAAVHDQLVRMRDHGLGFGLLRYLNPETAPLLARLRRPQILFNYLGRFDRRPDRDWELAPEAEAVGGGGDPDMPLTHLLEVSAIALDRSGRPELTTTLAYPTSLLSGRSVQALADLWCEALQAAAARARKERAIA
ncbi:condensation domain-containing protein [Streptomyces pseudogriseolus]|uniref:condensation domain-containing protein n=1 Tax=Streptomyces pseudogriseolus TaxID=36817 RepID=UPI003FA29B82